MAEVAGEGGGDAGLRLPAQVTLAQRSLGGPFGRGTLEVRRAKVPLVNGAAAPVTVTRVFLSPLADTRTGLAPRGVETALSAVVDKAALDPGEATTIQIAGAVPARPGSYTAQLLVATEAGQVAEVAVSVTVAAGAGWGIACMALGLLLLGILKLLTGAGEVQDKAREALRTRSEIHAWLQRDPPPQRRAEAVAEIDGYLDEAVRTLARPHSLSILDRRIQDANAALSAARDAVAKLRDVLAKVPPGSAEVTDLTEDWAALQERMRSLATLETAAAAPEVGLAAHAAVLLRRAWEQVIGLPLQWIAVDLGPQLERVRLAQAAGETDRARAMALATRGWLRRAADDLDRRLALMMGLNLSAAGMVASDAWIRRLAAGDELPPAQRAALLDQLAAADAGLAAGGTLEDLAAAIRAVAEVETAAYRERAEALTIRVQTVAATAAAEMSSEFMDEAMADLRTIPHPTTEQKAAALTRMLEVWRGRLGVIRDAEARTRMAAEIEAAEGAAQRRDLAATMQAVHGFSSIGRPTCRATSPPPAPRRSPPSAATGATAACSDWWRRRTT